MSKYQFTRLSGEKFEQMAQALIEKDRRNHGNLIQFGPGPDGSREATWDQPSSHPDYIRPTNESSDVPKKWVFQAKYHDTSLRGSSPAASTLLQDLKSELEKLTKKHNVKCHKYILITNISLSGSRQIGTRDQATAIAEQWSDRIPEIEIWDATDLSRMLDSQSDVRTAYSELILPGDILHAIYKQTNFAESRREATFKGYLKYLANHESKARADEAGDDEILQLSKVFIDQSLRLDREHIPENYHETVKSWTASNELIDVETLAPDDLNNVPASLALLWGAEERAMLLAGPGYGKSTITQFLALYQACRLVDANQAKRLASRLKLPKGWTPEKLDSFCPIRFPIRIELRRYAKWHKTCIDNNSPQNLAAYIAKDLIGRNVTSTLDEDDIFDLANKNPILLILDGLDEVPNKESRDAIIKECDAFIYRCSGEDANLQVIMSSRPQGYNGEFEQFLPLRWIINDLKESDFSSYCKSWLDERIRNADERTEAEERIKRGMQTDAVKRLATTLLQATVMLTIVRRKNDIPDERHALFAKYVDVVFQREKSKNDIIANYERELKLLHEMVGYRLHEAVARGEDGVLPGKKFREFVRDIWYTERGDQESSASPNRECERIIQLATDRLVFLTGKGEHQTGIDFVIQSYREYFAALYLYKNANADADQVYDELVTRGPFWENVLQFYTALASPAQQLAWLFKATDPTPLNSRNELAEPIEYKRAALASLPEYTGIKNPYIKDTISILFTRATWWTWTQQRWARPILSSFREGRLYKYLLEIYASIESPNRWDISFALWLFPDVISSTSPHFGKLTKIIEEAIQIPEHKSDALFIAISKGIPADLSGTNFATIAEALSNIPFLGERKTHRLSDVISRFSRPNATRLLCTRILHTPADNFRVWDLLGYSIDYHQELEEFRDSELTVDVVFKIRSWATAKFEETDHKPLDSSSKSDPYTKYIHSLYISLCDPENLTKNQNARIYENLLPEPPIRSLRTDSVIGPDIESFSSIEDWKRFHAVAKKIRLDSNYTQRIKQDLFEILNSLSKESYSWCTLLFHPSEWGFLVERELITQEYIKKARNSEIGKILSIPNKLIELLDIHFLDQNFNHKKLNTVLQLAADTHNSQRLFESNFVGGFLCNCNFSAISASEIKSTINSIKEPSTLPNCWKIVFGAAIFSCESLSAQEMIYLWRKIDQKLEHRIKTRHFTLDRRNYLAKALIDLDSPESLVLLAFICTPGSEVDSDILEDLNRYIVSYLSIPNPNIDERIIRCLYRTLPSLNEVRLYSNKDFLERITDRSDLIYEASLRINQTTQILPRSNFSQLREILEKIIEEGDHLPTCIVSAAMDTLIMIKYSSKPPLTEDQWQVIV